MKQLVTSFLFVLAGLFAVDRLGGMAMWWVNQHTHDVTGPKIRYLVNDVNEDVLMMGTSRCNLHYVPSIIRDTLGLSVYNGGIDASDNIYAHYLMLCHVLSKHKPKVICLELRTNDYAVSAAPFRTVSFFAPYFGINEEADSVFRLAGTYWRYKISHLYRYNAKAVSNIAGLFIDRQQEGDHGYIPLPQPAYFPDSLEKEETPTEVDSMKLKYVQRFISLCHTNGIKLVFVISPMFTKVNAGHYDALKTIAKNNHVPFLDYHTKGLYHDHPEYFKDQEHLWDKGARLFSSVFAGDLNQTLHREMKIGDSDIEMKHLTPYRQNETSLSPVRGKGMGYGNGIIK